MGWMVRNGGFRTRRGVDLSGPERIVLSGFGQNNNRSSTMAKQSKVKYRISRRFSRRYMAWSSCAEVVVLVALLAPAPLFAAQNAGTRAAHQASAAQMAPRGETSTMPESAGDTQLPATARTQLPATPDTPRPHYERPPAHLP
jgi:hypothetical protein